MMPLDTILLDADLGGGIKRFHAVLLLSGNVVREVEAFVVLDKLGSVPMNYGTERQAGLPAVAKRSW